MDDVEDEIEALRSIYGGFGEFELIQKGDGCTTATMVRLELRMADDDPSSTVSLTVTLTPQYPEVPLEISIASPDLTRRRAADLREHLQSVCEPLLGQPMVLEVVTCLQEVFDQYKTQEQCTTPSSDTTDKGLSNGANKDFYTGLLHLDHMNARSRYTRTILRWTAELSLTGRLVFLDKLILIILQGQLSNIKEYIHRQRTVSVDVDSRGKNCKERKLTILDEKPLDTNHRCKEFCIEELKHHEELHKLFVNLHIENMYQDHIPLLIKR